MQRSNMQQNIAVAAVVMGYAAMQCNEQLAYVIDHRRCVSCMHGSVVSPAFAGLSRSML